MPEPENNISTLDLTPGQMVDQYEIVRLLGKGGMGAVYLAIDTGSDHDDQQVAIKMLFPQLSIRSGDYIRRFLREARFACKINHPNLVKVHDCSFNDRYGIYYIVQEYVSGGTLKQLIHSDTVLREEEALTVAIGVSRALAAARKMGVVHRDIKPDNIMFAADGTIKLADWGIAKRLETGSLTEHTQELTKVKSFIGTPLYAAPEQIEDASQVDPRADIYSLGASLYYALVGKPPLKGNTEMESLVMVVRTKAPDVRNARPDVSEHAACIIARMLEKSPADRYQTPECLLVDLLAALRALGVSVPDSLPEIDDSNEMATPEDGTRIANLDRLHEILDTPEPPQNANPAPLPRNTPVPPPRNTPVPPTRNTPVPAARSATHLPTQPNGLETPPPMNLSKRLAIWTLAIVCIAVVAAGGAKAFIDYAARVRQRSEEDFIQRLEKARALAQGNSESDDAPTNTARLEQERLARLEAERQNRETTDKLAQAEAGRRADNQAAKQEAEQLAAKQAEAEAGRQAAAQTTRIERERQAKEADDKLAQAETARRTAEKAATAQAAKIEQENQARLEQERLARLEQERLAKEAADKLAQAETARRTAEQAATAQAAKIEQEKQARLEQERLARLEQERLAKEADDKLAQAETARRAAEQAAAEQAAKIEQEKQARLEQERLAKEAADKLAQAETARRAAEQAAAEQAARLEQEKQARLEQERLARLEQERLAKEAADKLAQAETARRAAQKAAAEQAARLEQEKQARLEQERLAKEAADKLAKIEAERRAAAETAQREASRQAETAKALDQIASTLTPDLLRQAISNADTTPFNGFPELQNAFTLYARAAESLQQARDDLDANEYFRNNRNPILFIDSCQEMWEIAGTMQPPPLAAMLQNETWERMLAYLLQATNNLLNGARFAQLTDPQQAKTRRQFLQLLAACDTLTNGKISQMPDDAPLRQQIMTFFNDMYYHPNIRQPEPDFPGPDPAQISWLNKSLSN